MKQKQMKGVCLLIAGILFLLLFFSFSGIEKTKLLDTDGRNFEKAEVIERSKGIYTLNNQMKITKDLSIIGNSRFKVTPFNDEEYNYLLAVNQIPRQLSIIKEKMDQGLAKESILKIHQKLKNIITKYT